MDISPSCSRSFFKFLTLLLFMSLLFPLVSPLFSYARYHGYIPRAWDFRPLSAVHIRWSFAFRSELAVIAGNVAIDKKINKLIIKILSRIESF